MLDTSPSTTYSQGVALGVSVGVQVLSLHLLWNQIEGTTPSDTFTAGTYVDPNGDLATLNSVLPLEGLELNLGILPSTTSISGMPSNLTATPMNDPLVVARFEAMLDWVFGKIPNVPLVSLALGNELDAYPTATTTDYWAQYWAFYAAVATHVRSLHPGIKVTVNATFAGLVGTSSNPLAEGGYQQLNGISDVIGVNYYPLNSDFTVELPSVVAGDFGKVAALYALSTTPKPIYFQEVGYPSDATACVSSQALQAEFVHQVFLAWDHWASAIPFLSIVRLNDLSATAAQSTAESYGFSAGSVFTSYLESLGLRSYTGSNKTAFSQLQSETEMRGW